MVLRKLNENENILTLKVDEDGAMVVMNKNEYIDEQCLFIY